MKYTVVTYLGIVCIFIGFSLLIIMESNKLIHATFSILSAVLTVGIILQQDLNNE